MKKNISFKILVVLIILSICLISFIGIFVSDQNQMKNLIPDYLLSMDLKGARAVKFAPDKSTEEVIYDSQGNIATDGENEDGTLKEGYMKKDEKINPDEVLKEENYEIVKNIYEKRLASFGIEDYTLRKNDKTGEITLEIYESNNVDEIIYDLEYLGEFTIKSSETEEVLMDNSNIKSAKAVYGTTEAGTSVYLNIEFNQIGKQKLEEITKEYIQTTDEDGKTVIKKITINLDGEKLTETYFGETISTGMLQLSVGNASTNSETISNYIEKASHIATLIESGKMPIQYKVESNINMSSAINLNTIKIIAIVIVLFTVIALGYLCIKYRINGILLSISYIGYLAILLIVLRYTNVVISIESLSVFVILLIANYMFINYILDKYSMKDISKKDIIKQTYLRYTSVLLPLLIISIVFTFIKWIPVASVGMVLFWGLTVMFIYNYIVINALLDDK